MKETIIEYLTDHAEDKASSIADYIGLKPSRTRDYLNELITEGVVVAEGGNRNRTYKLKAWGMQTENRIKKSKNQNNVRYIVNIVFTFQKNMAKYTDFPCFAFTRGL